MKWSAIVLAGSRPGGDPFAAEFGVDLKALIPVAAEPMVRRPVAALLASEDVDSVTVLGQQAERIAQALPDDPRLRVETSQGTIAETLLRLCEDPSTAWPVLVTTGDHALLDPEMVREFCAHAGQADVAVAVVSKRRLSRRLPESKRTWIPFRGGAYSGANLFALGSAKAVPAIHAWRSVEQDRKRAWKLISSMGPGIFLMVLLRRLTIDEALERIGRKLGVRVRAVHMTDPLAAVDVDKMNDHRLVEQLITSGR